MVILRHLTAHLAASLAVTGAVLASPFGHAARDADIATSFVSELTQNVSALHQDQQETQKRGLVCSQASSLTVDLGYAKYQGQQNTTTGVNVWKG